MSMLAYIQIISFSILLLLFLLQLTGVHRRVRIAARIACIVSGVVVFGFLAYYSYVQYAVWQGNELTQNFFSDGLGYFYSYVLYRIWAQYIISFIIAALFFWLSRRHNRRHDERFFYTEEPYLLALSLFLVGHPGWLLYLFVVLFSYVAFSIVYKLHTRRSAFDAKEIRVSFYYGWIPAALFVILMKEVILAVPLLQILVFSSGHLIL